MKFEVQFCWLVYVGCPSPALKWEGVVYKCQPETGEPWRSFTTVYVLHSEDSFHRHCGEVSPAPDLKASAHQSG